MNQESTQSESAATPSPAMRYEVIETRIFDGVVADEIIASIAEAIQERGRASVVLAGGSTPGAVYRALSRPPRSKEVAWGSVTLYWGDERWVPQEDQHSNFRMVQETLLAQLTAATPKVVGVDTSKRSAAESAEDYAMRIAQEEKMPSSAGARSLPQFDLVLLGVGEDGHFASIFPGNPLSNVSSLEEARGSSSGAWVVPVTHPVNASQRVSMTPLLLLNARRILLIVKGEAKAEIVGKVLNSAASPDELPAKLLACAGSRLTIFCDATAGKQLA